METRDKPLKNILYLIYSLYGAAIFAGFTALIGLVMLYLKRKELEAAGYGEHYHWLTNTFWITLGFGILAVVSAPWFGIGFGIGVATGIYYLWRVLKGFLCLKETFPLRVEKTA